MILIISILFTSGIELEGFLFFIFWGLIFSLLGDIMLLKPWYKFELGLATFLVGHIFYFTAFISYNGMDWDAAFYWICDLVISNDKAQPWQTYNSGRGIYVYYTIDGLAGDGYLAIRKKYIWIINRIRNIHILCI